MIDSAPVLALSRLMAAALPRPAAHAIASAAALANPPPGWNARRLVNYVRTRADLFYRHVPVEGPEELPRDAVYVSGHVGNWELGGAYIARRFGLSVLALRPTTAFSRFIDARRPATTVHTGGICWALRRLIRADGPVAALIDRPAGRIPEGPPAIAWLRDVPLVPFWMVLTRRGGYRFVMDEQIPADRRPGETRAEGTARLSARLADVVARIRARFPDQWFPG